LRIENNKPIFLKDHLNRFFNSATEMRLNVSFSSDELKNIISTLIQKNDLPSSGIRLTLSGGCSEDGYQISDPNLIITQNPLKLQDENVFNKGFKLCTFEHQRQLPQVKTIDYLMAIWLQPFIKSRTADDVLYFKNNIITECPRANIFMVTKDEKIITPKANILHGITRSKVLQIASNHFTAVEQDVSLIDLQNAKEVFITSSTKKILPVTQVDDVVFNNRFPGPVTKKLAQIFDDLLLAQQEEATAL